MRARIEMRAGIGTSEGRGGWQANDDFQSLMWNSQKIISMIKE